jgi:hypothetical protein
MILRSCILLVSLLSVAAAPKPSLPTLTPLDAVQWDYLTQEFTFWGITRFEVSWDGKAWSSQGKPDPYVNTLTSAGARSYHAPNPFTTGTHTAAVRACNTMGCGSSSGLFSFKAARK